MVQRTVDRIQKQQMGYAALSIIGQSCIGSAAAILLLMHDMPMAVKMTFVFLVTILCMGFNIHFIYGSLA